MPASGLVLRPPVRVRRFPFPASLVVRSSSGPDAEGRLGSPAAVRCPLGSTWPAPWVVRSSSASDAEGRLARPAASSVFAAMVLARPGRWSRPRAPRMPARAVVLRRRFGIHSVTPTTTSVGLPASKRPTAPWLAWFPRPAPRCPCSKRLGSFLHGQDGSVAEKFICSNTCAKRLLRTRIDPRGGGVVSASTRVSGWESDGTSAGAAARATLADTVTSGCPSGRCITHRAVRPERP